MGNIGTKLLDERQLDPLSLDDKHEEVIDDKEVNEITNSESRIFPGIEICAVILIAVVSWKTFFRYHCNFMLDILLNSAMHFLCTCLSLMSETLSNMMY